MSQIACPHCGFQNFAISAYCGRCERPLRPGGAATARDATPPPRTPKPKPSLVRDRPAPKLVPPPADSAQETVRQSEPAREPSRPRPVPTAVSAPRDATPAPRPVAATAPRNVPAPAPPPHTRDLEPAPLPIELKLPEPEPPRDALSERDTRPPTEASPDVPIEEPPPPPLSTSPPAEAEPQVVEVPVTVASELRLVVGWILDGALVVAVGALVAVVEALLFAGTWRQSRHQPLDVLADWLAANSDAALHGAVVTVLAALFYALYAGRRGGRTLGRILTGTVLVRASGRPLSWPVVIFRTFVGIFSTVPFFAGFFWVLLDRQRRTWHDLMAGTVVVRRHIEVGASAKPDDTT